MIIIVITAVNRLLHSQTVYGSHFPPWSAAKVYGSCMHTVKNAHWIVIRRTLNRDNIDRCQQSDDISEEKSIINSRACEAVDAYPSERIVRTLCGCRPDRGQQSDGHSTDRLVRGRHHGFRGEPMRRWDSAQARVNSRSARLIVDESIRSVATPRSLVKQQHKSSQTRVCLEHACTGGKNNSGPTEV